MKFTFIRHTSVDVPRGVCYGITDVPLASSFETEAQRVKSTLAGNRFDLVFCSPLSRCVRLAQYCGYPDAIRDERLKELDFGDWEMKYFDEISDPTLQAWYDDYINVTPTNGESVASQRERLENFVTEMKRTHSEASIGIFTHGGILINALVAFGGKTYDEIYNDIPSYGAIISIEI